MYSQKPLLDLLKSGKVFGETGGIKKHIETVVSNVFVFPEQTYKVYKNDNEYFNKNFRDISGKKARLEFTRRDFEWNQKLNDDVYVGLKSVAVVNGEGSMVQIEAAEEYVMIMNTFPEDSVLMNIFKHGVPDKFDAYQEGARFAELQQKLPELPTSHLDPIAVSIELCEDVYHWTLMQKNKFREGELERYFDFIKKLITQDEVVKQYFREHLATSMDVHMGNALYYQNKLMLIDTFSPKDSWLIKHSCGDVYRLGTDIRVFMGEETWELFKAGYYSVTKEHSCPQSMDTFSTLYAALIMIPYLFSLGENHVVQAEKYLSFLRGYFEKQS